MITLVMIVRDEEKTIADTLRVILPAVDRVCIVDTGSRDSTLNEIRDILLNHPFSGDGNRRYFVDSLPWVDYSTNRNQALALAVREFGPDQWLLMLDADVRVEGAQALRRHLRQWAFGSTSFQLMAQFKDGGLRWPMHRIFRAGSGWRYQGAVHEVPVHPNRGIVAPGPIIPGVTVVYQGTDWKDKTPTWREHERLLLQEWETTGNPRSLFYLAQTLACLGEQEKARDLYLKRHRVEGGFAPETWFAGYQYVWLSQTLQAHIDPGRIISLALERPWRAEAWYRAALEYGDLGQWDRCYAYACIASSLPVPRPELDAYMIQTDVYHWEANVLRAIAMCEIEPKGPRVLAEICRAHRESTGLPEAEQIRLNQLEERAR